MCGIAGFQGDFPAVLLTRMSAAVAHRGPDGAGEVMLPGKTAAGRVGLAHRRLAIIDLSAEGAQPMTVACARCGADGLDELTLIYNGEVYNFPELRSELEGRGHAFHSRTDSEVLLHLYAELGPAMLARLNGIFAFAIRDGRRAGRPPGIELGDLLLARDPLGVKPLYHARSARGFLFASELKALLMDPELSRELDHSALHQMLAYLWAPAPRTMLQAVRKLPPGRAMLVRDGEVQREWSYWDFPYGTERLALSEGEIAEALREHTFAAVRRQLVADVPV